jgi:DNA topoisomerase-3
LKVTVDDDTCVECGSQYVTVTYKQEKTPFADGDDKKTGCVFCSNEFMPLIEKHKAVENRRLNSSSRGRSSRGRGRGRSHRGRPKAPKDKMAQLAAYFV